MCWSLCVEEGVKSLHSRVISPVCRFSHLWFLQVIGPGAGYRHYRPLFPLVPTCLSCTEDEKKIIYCWLIHSFFEGSSQCQGLRQIAAKAHWHRSYRALGRALQSTCYSKKTTQRSSPDVKPKPMNISGIRNKRRCGALQLPHKSTFRAHVLVNDMRQRR